MRKLLRHTFLATALAAVGVLPAMAQTSSLHLGPRVGYNFDAEEFTLGGQLSVPVSSRLEFYPSADVHFVEVGSLWTLNADLKYRFSGESMNWFYAGAGLGFRMRSFNDNDNTDTGFNMFFGAESLRGRVHPFGEARVTLSDGSMFMLVGGLNFTI